MNGKAVPEEFPWMAHALGDQGVKELLGKGSNDRVIEYLKTTTLPLALAGDDETPWCSAFVNWCVTRAGVKGTDSAAARSWLTWGQPLEVPRRGCIAVLSRVGGGHVGFYLRTVGSQIHLFGGNQNNQVGTRAYDGSRLLGYRIP